MAHLAHLFIRTQFKIGAQTHKTLECSCSCYRISFYRNQSFESFTSNFNDNFFNTRIASLFRAFKINLKIVTNSFVFNEHIFEPLRLCISQYHPNTIKSRQKKNTIKVVKMYKYSFYKFSFIYKPSPLLNLIRGGQELVQIIINVT